MLAVVYAGDTECQMEHNVKVACVTVALLRYSATARHWQLHMLETQSAGQAYMLLMTDGMDVAEVSTAMIRACALRGLIQPCGLLSGAHQSCLALTWPRQE